MKLFPRVFYGWWIVVVCLLVQGVAAGVTIYPFSIFAGEVEGEFSVSRAVVMLGFTAGNVVGGLLAPILGGVMDRWSVKWTMMLSAMVMGIGFIGMAFSPSIWGIVGGYTLLLPVGSTVLVALASPLLLSRWFVRKRGLVIGIAALGSQFGGFLLPPVIAMLIDLGDWRLAMLSIGVFSAVAVPALIYWVIVDRPGQIDLAPDGEPTAALDKADVKAEASPSAKATNLRIVLADRNFWLVGLGIAVLVGMMSTVLGNLALIANEIGATREQAAMLISVYAVIGMISSPLIGRLCDVLDIRIVLAAMMSLAAAAMLCFLMASSFELMLLATVVTAFPGGGVMPFWGAIIGRLFDIRFYGRVMGAMAILVISASAGTPLLAGWLYDVTGSYATLFVLLAASMVIPVAYSPLIRIRAPEAAAEPVSA